MIHTRKLATASGAALAATLLTLGLAAPARAQVAEPPIAPGAQARFSVSYQFQSGCNDAFPDIVSRGHYETPAREVMAGTEFSAFWGPRTTSADGWFTARTDITDGFIELSYFLRWNCNDGSVREVQHQTLRWDIQAANTPPVTALPAATAAGALGLPALALLGLRGRNAVVGLLTASVRCGRRTACSSAPARSGRTRRSSGG